MTIIAFDGTSLVADGASVVRNPRTKSLLDQYHINKIVVPEFDWVDERSKVTIKALAGTGNANDIDDIISELLCAGRTGQDMDDKIAGLQFLLGRRSDCQIVYVGFETRANGKRIPIAHDLIKTGSFKAEKFQLIGSRPAVAGCISNFPKWRLKEGWNSALEVVSLCCALKPGSVGGMLSRYNIQTGRLDHPKLSPPNRLKAMINKREREVMEIIKKEFDQAREFVKNPINTY